MVNFSLRTRGKLEYCAVCSVGALIAIAAVAGKSLQPKTVAVSAATASAVNNSIHKGISSSSSFGASSTDLRVLDVLAPDAAPQLPHEGLEVPEALQHGLVRQEANVLDVVVRLVLLRRGTTKGTDEDEHRIIIQQTQQQQQQWQHICEAQDRVVCPRDEYDSIRNPSHSV